MNDTGQDQRNLTAEKLCNLEDRIQALGTEVESLSNRLSWVSSNEDAPPICEPEEKQIQQHSSIVSQISRLTKMVNISIGVIRKTIDTIEV